MSDKDVPQPVERDVGANQLFGRSVTAVDKIGDVVDDDQRRRITSTCLTKPWPTLGPEQHNPRGFPLLSKSVATEERIRKSERHSTGEKPSACGLHVREDNQLCVFSQCRMQAM